MEVTPLVSKPGLTVIAALDDVVFATGPSLDEIYRYDAATGEELDVGLALGGETGDLTMSEPADLAVGGESVWLTHADGEVWQLTKSLDIESVWGGLPAKPGEIVADEDGSWIAAREAGVARVGDAGGDCATRVPLFCTAQIRRLPEFEPGVGTDITHLAPGFEESVIALGPTVGAGAADPAYPLGSPVAVSVDRAGDVIIFARGRMAQFSHLASEGERSLLFDGKGSEYMWVRLDLLTPGPTLVFGELTDAVGALADVVGHDGTFWLATEDGRLARLRFTSVDPTSSRPPEVDIIDLDR